MERSLWVCPTGAGISVRLKGQKYVSETISPDSRVWGSSLRQAVDRVAASGAGLAGPDLPDAFQYRDLAAPPLQAGQETADGVGSPAGDLGDLRSASAFGATEQRQHLGALGVGPGAARRTQGGLQGNQGLLQAHTCLPGRHRRLGDAAQAGRSRTAWR